MINCIIGQLDRKVMPGGVEWRSDRDQENCTTLG